MADEKTRPGEVVTWMGTVGALSLRVLKQEAKIGTVVLWDVWRGDDCLATGAAPFQRDEAGELRIEGMKDHAIRIAKATARAIVLGEAA